MTCPPDAQQWCAECGNAMHADAFGARQKCCNGWGYWAAIKPEPRDSWWPAIQQRGLYLYRNEAKWPKGMNPVLPIAGGTDRQTEEVMRSAQPAELAGTPQPVAGAAEPQAAALYTAADIFRDACSVAYAPYVPQVCRICGHETHHIGDVCFFCTKEAKVTTSSERAQIPAESEHVRCDVMSQADTSARNASAGSSTRKAGEMTWVAPYDRCPTCTAHIPVGKTCGGDECGLRGK